MEYKVKERPQVLTIYITVKIRRKKPVPTGDRSYS